MLYSLTLKGKKTEWLYICLTNTVLGLESPPYLKKNHYNSELQMPLDKASSRKRIPLKYSLEITLEQLTI